MTNNFFITNAITTYQTDYWISYWLQNQILVIEYQLIGYWFDSQIIDCEVNFWPPIVLLITKSNTNYLIINLVTHYQFGHWLLFNII